MERSFELQRNVLDCTGSCVWSLSSGLYAIVLTHVCGVSAVQWRGEEMVRKALEHNASLPLAPFQSNCSVVLLTKCAVHTCDVHT